MAAIVAPTVRYVARPRRIARSLEFARRCHLFKITKEQAMELPLDKIQAMVKQRYRVLAKRYHPDRTHCTEKRLIRPLTGALFRRYAKSYQWFMALREEQVEHKPPIPAPSYDAPWAWERHAIQYSDAQIYGGI